MKLYHYTSIYHLTKILKDGYIKTTESNANFEIEHFAKDVVWLTTQKNPDHELSLNGLLDKKQVRITVKNVPAKRYIQWADENGVEKYVVDALNKSGGNQMFKWNVVERIIPQHEWEKIELFDYTNNKWLPYSKVNHSTLLGKVLVKQQDGSLIRTMD